MQKTGAQLYSRTVTTSSANQELLVQSDFETLYNCKGSLPIHFECYNLGDAEITLMLNNNVNSLVKLDAKYGEFSTDGKVEVTSVKVVESGSNVKFLCVLP